MNALSGSEIKMAAQRIASYVRRTPVLDVVLNSHDTPVNLKLELLQHTGSFKVRGAFNGLLGQAVPSAGVSAVSGGNHGAAVAYAARALGHKARIFVPGFAPAYKVARIRAQGGEVVQEGDEVAHAIALWDAYVAQTGALGLHPYDAYSTLQGQATTALEWHEQTPDLDTVLIAVGGGGLIGGMAAYFDKSVKVIAVETEGCGALHLAWAKNEPTTIKPSGVAADSLGAPRVGNLMFANAKALIDSVILVSDDQVRAAQRHLWNDAQIVSEPGGAAAFAALLAGVYKPAKGERVGVLVCGANTDPEVFAQMIKQTLSP
jgi:threonine dehydratase